jgi:hypothetical protein
VGGNEQRRRGADWGSVVTHTRYITDIMTSSRFVVAALVVCAMASLLPAAACPQGGNSSGPAPLFTISGSVPEKFGAGFISIPDQDGDLQRDVAVGSPAYNGGRGRVQIFSSATQQELASFPGIYSSGGLGYSLDLQDYNADGVDDLVVRTRWQAWPSNGTCETVVLELPSLTPLWRKTGNGESWFGSFSALMPDADGDNLAEVFVMESDNNCAGTDSGKAWMFDASGTERWSLCSGGAWDYWGNGHSPAVMPDLNGDNYPDLAIPAPETCGCVPGPGYLRVLDGMSGSTIWTVVGDGWPSRIVGAQLAGDVDSDNVPDIAALHMFPSVASTSSLRVYSGASGAQLASASMPGLVPYMTGAGADIDGDGSLELPVAAFDASGAHHILILSVAAQSVLVIWVSPFAGAEVSDLAFVTDFDGDAIPDLEASSAQAGQCVIYSSATLLMPAAASVYGTGCGSPPLQMTPQAPPILGSVGSAEITNVPVQLGGVTMGFSDTLLTGLPILPLSLASLGMPGCELLHSNDVFGLPVTAGASGTLDFSYTIPSNVNLLGAQVYLQAYCYAPGANALEIIASNGVEWVIGNQ